MEYGAEPGDAPTHRTTRLWVGFPGCRCPLSRCPGTHTHHRIWLPRRSRPFAVWSGRTTGDNGSLALGTATAVTGAMARTPERTLVRKIRALGDWIQVVEFECQRVIGRCGVVDGTEVAFTYPTWCADCLALGTELSAGGEECCVAARRKLLALGHRRYLGPKYGNRVRFGSVRLTAVSSVDAANPKFEMICGASP